MPVLARAIARTQPNTIKPFDAASLREFVLFCGTGGLALILLITQDLDIGTSLF